MPTRRTMARRPKKKRRSGGRVPGTKDPMNTRPKVPGTRDRNEFNDMKRLLPRKNRKRDV